MVEDGERTYELSTKTDLWTTDRTQQQNEGTSEGCLEAGRRTNSHRGHDP